MKILVTGCAGFIGYHLTKRLLTLGYAITGLDNINDYYDPQLKYDRLADLGLQKADIDSHQPACSSDHPALKFYKMDITDQKAVFSLFESASFDLVVNLAAQAGVRYSITDPQAYLDSNITGFFNILEACRHHGVAELLYASSSSVYGMGDEFPLSVISDSDHPVSLYAATKKSNELFAHCYSHLFGINTTAMRFFTVYGPWGRPDMAMYLFTRAIAKGEPIKVFNHGEMRRDFTYIDDIVDGVIRIISRAAKNFSLSDREGASYRIYNIGQGKPVALVDFISAIEAKMGRTAQREFLPMQPGDVLETWADIAAMQEDFNYAPTTAVAQGVSEFVDWFESYYHLESSQIMLQEALRGEGVEG